MDIITHILQLATCLGMIACTGIWFWLWAMNLKNHLRLRNDLDQIKKQIEVLAHEVKVIQEPCYRGDCFRGQHG